MTRKYLRVVSQNELSAKISYAPCEVSNDSQFGRREFSIFERQDQRTMSTRQLQAENLAIQIELTVD